VNRSTRGAVVELKFMFDSIRAGQGWLGHEGEPTTPHLHAELEHLLEQLLACSVCELARVFLTSEISYLFFPNLTHKIGTA